jgi:hypothetical protein
VIPAVDNSHVTEGVALLTSRYKGQPVITGLVTALMARLQVIEASYWSLINATMLANHPMAGGPWSILDQLGYLVGVLRNGLDDADFLALIKLQAKVNRSRGTPEDVLSLGTLMAAPGSAIYLEMPLAAFYLACLNVALNYPIFYSLIRQARAAGVYGLLIYTTWAPGNDDIFGSRYDSTAGQGSWGSRYDAAAGGLAAAAVSLG